MILQRTNIAFQQHRENDLGSLLSDWWFPNETRNTFPTTMKAVANNILHATRAKRQFISDSRIIIKRWVFYHWMNYAHLGNQWESTSQTFRWPSPSTPNKQRQHWTRTAPIPTLPAKTARGGNEQMYQYTLSSVENNQNANVSRQIVLHTARENVSDWVCHVICTAIVKF